MERCDLCGSDDVRSVVAWVGQVQIDRQCRACGNMWASR